MAILLPSRPSSSPLRVNFPATVSNTSSASPLIMATSTSVPSSLSSPSSAMFSESGNLLEEVRKWSEADVAEWLCSVNFAKYTNNFTVNHINGEALLEVDKNVIKEIGIDKIGDRVRLFVAIKALRTKCYAGSRKHISTLGQLDQSFVPSFTPSASSSTSPSFNTSRPESPRYIASTTNTLSSQSVSLSSLAQQPIQRNEVATSLQHSSNSSQASISSTPISNSSLAATQASTSSSLSSQSKRSESLAGGIARFISNNGFSKVVDVSNCYNAESIKKTVVRKFGLKESPDSLQVFVVSDSGSVRVIGDLELVAICHSTAGVERERLILCKNGQTPSEEEYQKSIQIAREQHARKAPRRPGTFIDTGRRTGSETGRIKDRQSIYDTDTAVLQDEDISSRQKRLRNFFGQRPPSELISSNLAEYFPGHESRLLERTARNSIRHSRRISSVSKRISVATTSSYASSTHESMPPVPNIGDTWLSTNSATQQQQNNSINNVKFNDGTSPIMRHPSTSSNRIASSDANISTIFDARDDELDFRPSHMDDEVHEQHDDALTSSYPVSNRRSRIFTSSRSDIASSSLSDNNSYIEVDSIVEIAEELSDTELESEDTDSGPTRWLRGRLIGSGSFGTVVLGVNALTGELMAVKQVELTTGDNKGDSQKKKAMIDALHREINLLRELQHENIVTYKGSSSDGQFLNIFLEYVPGGSVATMLIDYGPLEEPLIRSFVRQILCGLTYLHDKDIIHRDIKGANVLVDDKGKIKISDFGISKKVEAGLLSKQHHRPSLQGSVYWMAPEVVKQTSYTRKADIWSLGCLVVEMFTGTHPFPEFSQMQALFKIGTLCAPEIPKNASEEARDFLKQTFELDHLKRPSASELLDHSFAIQSATPTGRNR
ncbi:kinase-like domain-containing protein [Dipodascopsis uninucleata]